LPGGDSGQAKPASWGLDMAINSPDNTSIGVGLSELERALSWTIDDLDRIARLKVRFSEKRIPMEIEPLENGPGDERKYALRYRDQSLSLRERQAFEDLIEQDHGIKVVTTEKRGARGRRTRAA